MLRTCDAERRDEGAGRATRGQAVLVQRLTVYSSGFGSSQRSAPTGATSRATERTEQLLYVRLGDPSGERGLR